MPQMGALAATDVWAAAARTLTGFTGQPRTDLDGSDVAVWAAVTRALTAFTGQPRTDLVGTNDPVWATATRTLSAFAAESLLNPGIFQGHYLGTKVTQAAVADTFGLWAQCFANVGNGKWLMGVVVSDFDGVNRDVEVEIGEGGAGSEVAVVRLDFSFTLFTQVGGESALFIPVWKKLTDGARISGRAKGNNAAASSTVVRLLVT